METHLPAFFSFSNSKYIKTEIYFGICQGGFDPDLQPIGYFYNALGTRKKHRQACE